VQDAFFEAARAAAARELEVRVCELQMKLGARQASLDYAERELSLRQAHNIDLQKARGLRRLRDDGPETAARRRRPSSHSQRRAHDDCKIGAAQSSQ
jgi:hypothetical protein